MNQLSRILAAVDFSEPGPAAFDRALARSRAQGADLTVVDAVPLVSVTYAAAIRCAIRGRPKRKEML